MKPKSAIRYTLFGSVILLIMSLTACGGNTRDSGPSRTVNVSSVPDAIPKYEKQTRAGNPKTYVVFGKRYYVKRSNGRYHSRGIASWYGKKFHGRKTSNGETYNMYAMTAAHKTLRIPAYVKVTNLENGRVIVVRVNDRGPFVNNRIIDLSYAAAHKLGITRKGTGLVKIAVVGAEKLGVPIIRQSPAAPKLAVTTPSLNTTRWQHNESVFYTTIAGREVDPNPDDFGVVTHGPAKNTQVKSAPKQLRRVKKIKPKVPSPAYQRRHEKPKQQFVGSHRVYLQVGAFFDQKNAQRLLNKVRSLSKTSAQIFRSNKNNRPLFRVRVGPITTTDQVDQVATKLNDHGISNTRVVID